MPVDARLLLRQAATSRAQSISDPFASYSATGALRCSTCNYLTIKHESLWSSHALSKSHRNNVTKIREEELRQAEVQRVKEGKRKADEGLDEQDGSRAATMGAGEEQEADAEPESKKARTDSNDVDPDWALFKSQMEGTTEIGREEPTEVYNAGAALEAEAQLIWNDGAATGQDVEDEIEEKSKEELEAEERARKEQEEREEILSRLEEEQRQQDEADQRVSALKQRLQRIKQARLDKQKARKKA